MKKVGVNLFREDEEPARAVELHPYRAAEAEAQITRLHHIRRTRDAEAVARTLRAVGDAARVGDNVMHEVLAAVRAYATVGEICGVLREVFGTYEEPIRW
jgi:methylmalonyl-CoA mutase N-terminal domain/subunit